MAIIDRGTAGSIMENINKKSRLPSTLDLYNNQQTQPSQTAIGPDESTLAEIIRMMMQQNNPTPNADTTYQLGSQALLPSMSPLWLRSLGMRSTPGDLRGGYSGNS